jgi:uncharacterized protein (DUF934 family)
MANPSGLPSFPIQTSPVVRDGSRWTSRASDTSLWNKQNTSVTLRCLSAPSSSRSHQPFSRAVACDATISSLIVILWSFPLVATNFPHQHIPAGNISNKTVVD